MEIEKGLNLRIWVVGDADAERVRAEVARALGGGRVPGLHITLGAATAQPAAQHYDAVPDGVFVRLFVTGSDRPERDFATWVTRQLLEAWGRYQGRARKVPLFLAHAIEVADEEDAPIFVAPPGDGPGGPGNPPGAAGA